MPASKALKEFVASIHKDKLCGWKDEQYTILTDRKLGYRLDHQGMNKDPATKPHRIYIQPVAGGKSRESQALDPGTVLAAIHSDDPEDEERIREALIASAKKDGETVVV